MRIKQFIVTYNNQFQINKCLKNIFDSLLPNELEILDIYIINNHSNFNLNKEFSDKVTILHNNLRPDFSTGHLSRNWNQAIINGFKDLSNSDCDILITNQDDTEFQPNYILNLLKLHERYDLIQFGAGDNFISYTSNHIKKVGLWDERFCNIGYQEADYFLRSVIYNKDKVSINDIYHNRVNNEEHNTIIRVVPNGYARGEEYHKSSMIHHSLSKKIFKEKWGFEPSEIDHASINWDFENLINLEPKIQSFIYYPYFEKDINKESLISQKFII